MTTLDQLRTTGYTEIKDIYSDNLYRYYDYYKSFYVYEDVYLLVEEKKRDYESWKTKILVNTIHWEYIPENVKNEFKKLFPNDFSLLIKKNFMNNIKEKFVLALTAEPQKSFRKAGITNGDDILTEDGQKVFLSYLLHKKFAEEFKKEVVEDLLKEEKEEEKK